MSLRSIARDFAYRHVGGSVVVLVYHRVTSLERDPQLLAVDPARFDEHVRALAARWDVISLPDLAQAVHTRLPRRAVALSFDDGYADNLHEAAPVLERYGVPSTVFVSSGYAEAQREFWWDEIERLALLAERLPARLELAAGNASFLAEDVWGAPDADASWNVELPARTPRQRLYLDLCAFVRPLASPEREAALARLRELADVPAEPRSTYRPLSAGEVRALAALPHMSVGGHARTHQLLAARAEDEQREEIAKDRERLGEMVGREPDVFAYPYGGPDSFTEATARLAGDAGYTAAFANDPRPVKPWSDPLRLPRFIVRNWSGDELARRIEAWFDGRA